LWSWIVQVSAVTRTAESYAATIVLAVTGMHISMEVLRSGLMATLEELENYPLSNWQPLASEDHLEVSVLCTQYKEGT